MLFNVECIIEKKVIGVSGKSGSGKTLFSSLLIPEIKKRTGADVAVISFAAYLKNLLRKTGVTKMKFEPNEDLFEEYFSDYSDYINIHKIYLSNIPPANKFRLLAQIIGTDYFRRKNPNIFAEKLYEIALALTDKGVQVIIDDIRFMNEWDIIKNNYHPKDISLIFIKANPPYTYDHESENLVIELMPEANYIIFNNLVNQDFELIGGTMSRGSDLNLTKMSLWEQQALFTKMVARLLNKAFEMGYSVTLGDAYRDPRVFGKIGESKGYGSPESFHKKRLAIDLNLFKDGVYLGNTKDHLELGEWWESIGGTWGGRFNDGNHYSLGE